MIEFSYLVLVKLRSRVSSLRTPSILNRRLLPKPILFDSLDNLPPLISVQRVVTKELSLKNQKMMQRILKIAIKVMICLLILKKN